MPTRRAFIAGALAAPAILPRLVRAQADTRPVLRIAVQALPPTLEPLESISNVGLRLTYNVFDTLLRRDFLAEAHDGGQHLVPHLATALTQRDPLTWEIPLRPGVRLQDGGGLTAEDALSTFSAERMCGPPEQAETLARDVRLEGVDVALDFAHILYYDTRQPALRDARVRRALNHAVDYDMLGSSLWGDGFRRMAALQIPTFGPLYDAGRKGFEYDPERARRLLREAGYRGDELIIRIAPGYYLQMLQAVQIVQQMC